MSARYQLLTSSLYSTVYEDCHLFCTITCPSFTRHLIEIYIAPQTLAGGYINIALQSYEDVAQYMHVPAGNCCI